VQFTVIRKTRVKSCRGQTWSGFAKPEVILYFGLLFDKSKFGVAESKKTDRRHISTSGLASRAPGTRYFALFWPVLSPYRTLTARNVFYKNTGCTKSKSWPGSAIQKPEVLSKMPEIIRNAVKFIFIRKMREKTIFLLPVWPLEPQGRSFLPYLACIVAVSYIDG